MLKYIALAFLTIGIAVAAQTPGGAVKEFSAKGLFALKSMLEAQLEHDFIEGSNAKSDGAFDFLIGEWDLVRTSFDEDGNVASRTKGTVVAHYAFEGRVIQEDFYNYRDDGLPYRGGTALYIFNISRDTYEWEQKVSIDGVSWFPNYHIINHRKN